VDLTAVPTPTPSLGQASSYTLGNTQEPTKAATPFPTVPSNMTFKNTSVQPIRSKQSATNTIKEDQFHANTTIDFSTSAEPNLAPPTLQSTSFYTPAATSRSINFSIKYPTAFPTEPLNLKPALSTASIEIEKDDDAGSDSSVSDDDDNGGSSLKKRKPSKKALILTAFFAILCVTIIAICIFTTRWCLRRWSGYTPIGITEETIELTDVRNIFPYESVDPYDENTYLKNRVA